MSFKPLKSRQDFSYWVTQSKCCFQGSRLLLVGNTITVCTERNLLSIFVAVKADTNALARWLTSNFGLCASSGGSRFMPFFVKQTGCLKYLLNTLQLQESFYPGNRIGIFALGWCVSLYWDAWQKNKPVLSLATGGSPLPT